MNDPAKLHANCVVILCFVAGCTDVLSYLTLGRVFTSAMTGCAAIFLIGAVGANMGSVYRAGIALVSYGLGVVLGVAMQPRIDKQATAATTLRRLTAVESGILALYAAIAIAVPHAPSFILHKILIFISALAMGVQSIVARDLREPSVSTVVLNPTLTSLFAGITRRARGIIPSLPKPNRLHMLVLLAYGIGGIATAFAVMDQQHWVNVLPLAGVLAVLALLQRAVALEPDRFKLNRQGDST